MCVCVRMPWVLWLPGCCRAALPSSPPAPCAATQVMFDLAVVRGLLVRHTGPAGGPLARGLAAATGGASLDALARQLVPDASGEAGSPKDPLSVYNDAWGVLEPSLDIVDWQMTKEYFFHAVQVGVGCVETAKSFLQFVVWQ